MEKCTHQALLSYPTVGGTRLGKGRSQREPSSWHTRKEPRLEWFAADPAERLRRKRRRMSCLSGLARLEIRQNHYDVPELVDRLQHWRTSRSHPKRCSENNRRLRRGKRSFQS